LIIIIVIIYGTGRHGRMLQDKTTAFLIADLPFSWHILDVLLDTKIIYSTGTDFIWQEQEANYTILRGRDLGIKVGIST
jgi:hypothetical protein